MSRLVRLSVATLAGGTVGTALRWALVEGVGDGAGVLGAGEHGGVVAGLLAHAALI